MATNEPRWHPEAISDAQNARDWYSERSVLAARGFLLALEASVNATLEAPEGRPVGPHGCRLYVFPDRYPYTLVYRIAREVEIVAVAHHKRHPSFWSHR